MVCRKAAWVIHGRWPNALDCLWWIGKPRVIRKPCAISQPALSFNTAGEANCPAQTLAFRFDIRTARRINEDRQERYDATIPVIAPQVHRRNCCVVHRIVHRYFLYGASSDVGGNAWYHP